MKVRISLSLINEKTGAPSGKALSCVVSAPDSLLTETISPTTLSVAFLDAVAEEARLRAYDFLERYRTATDDRERATGPGEGGGRPSKGG